MKRRVFLAFMLFMGVWAAGAQTCTLRFTGTDKQQHYVKLDHVKIFNKTQLWQEVIYWPDTTLVLGGTGVEEYDIAKGFRIMQNTPNPFSGSTEFAITLPQERSVLIEIFDISGKKVISKSFGRLEAGTHIFNVTLQTPNTYIANATIKDGQMTIKMINEGHGAANDVEYAGMRGISEIKIGKGERYIEAYPFASGDMMEYTGYASIGGTEYQSVTVQQKQYGSETISLRFSQLGLPEVTTLNADNITSYTSRLNGNVTSLGGVSSVLRGFCWTKTTDGTPTISDNIVQEWGTTGEYSKTISGLEPGESYCFRAYATNSIGTNYGQQKVFTTAPVNPIVVTKNITNITGTSANVGGEISSTGGAAITARGVCWSTTQNPTINGNHTTDGNGFGSFVSLISDLEPGTTYYVRAYATNSAGTGYGAQKSFTTLCTAPIVTTGEVSDIGTVTSTTAKCAGNVTHSGGATVTARGVCWSTSPAPTLSDSHVTNGSGTGSYVSVMTNLQPGTVYYVRAYATNNVGTSYGAVRSFTQPAVLPTVTTNTLVNNITSSSATCSSEVVNDGGADVVSRGVCWNTVSNPTIGNNHTNDGYGVGTFTSSMTNMSPGTVYYVRAFATNSVGTAYSAQRSFVTNSIPPTVLTENISSIGGTSATVGGNVTADGGAEVTARGICWSTTQNPTVSNSHTSNGSGTGTFTAVINNLSPSTTYYVRAYATNSKGTSYGVQKVFTTVAVPPSVTTDDITNITLNSAVSGGSVLNDGGANVTSKGVCWSTFQNPTISDAHTSDGSGTGSFTSNIIGLVSGTTYYIRAYATNSAGTSYGEQRSFQTLQLPSVTTKNITNITANSATSGGNVTSAGSSAVEARGVCWSLNPNPTIEDNHTLNGYGVGNYTSTISFLLPGTIYYVRAYATSSVGTAYGEERTFTTNITLPTVTTNIVSAVGGNFAICGGNVTSDGGSEIIARGVCWSKTHSPTVNDNYTTDSVGTGLFTSNITELEPVTVYYIRAYATNIVGTAYGEERMVTTLAVQPTVTTKDITDIKGVSATCGGDVSFDGGSEVTERGVCWNTTGWPTIEDDHTTDGAGSGEFTSLLTNLSPSTTYYVRAYAINNVGISYGGHKSFTTMNTCPGTPTVTDIDGNVYNTVQIGEQCWMRENLRTTRYDDGRIITLGSDTSSSLAFRYYPNNNSSNVATYGYLYNWKAVMDNSLSSNSNPSGIKGICPTGWHVPSDLEWRKLRNYLSREEFICDTTDENTIGKTIASKYGWTYSDTVCDIGYLPENNDATGFSAYPAGYRWTGIYNFGVKCYLWGATQFDESTSYYRCLYNDSPFFYRGWGLHKGYGLSVRCVYGGEYIPTVKTILVDSVTATSAYLHGEIIEEGSSVVLSRGFCWSTSPEPTLNDSYTTTNNNETNFFTSIITELAYGTQYYVRAYATNSAGTSYGEQLIFKTLNPCIGTLTVTDIDGNVYNTVQIGEQCWMRENLRTTHYVDGTAIALGSTTSTTTAYRYYPNNDSNNVATYGFLYNWKAVMGNSSSSAASPSGVHGICPTGWHVPSYAEWEQLTNYVSSQSEYVCGNNTTNIAKALAATTGWSSSTTSCAVGNNQSANNATDFSAMPAGCRSNDYGGFGKFAYFWSTNKYSSYAVNLVLAFRDPDVDYSSYNSIEFGNSVRCVKDDFSTNIITDSVYSINSTSAFCKGTITCENISSITARGFCWSTSMNPTIDDSHTVDSVGIGSFTSSITGLTSGAVYYVRAYATYNGGTIYGNQLTFTTNDKPELACPDAPTVTDIDGNIYNTVQIGEQCWMKENLRTTRYSDGIEILMAPEHEINYEICYRYNPTNIPIYGYLYNWKAAMKSSTSSSDYNSSGIKGVCPNGWHLPSRTEWEELINFIQNNNHFYCNDSSNNIAKAFAASFGWNSSSIDCAVGNEQILNNKTGFSALPASISYFTFNVTNFGSSTSRNMTEIFSVGISHNSTSLQIGCCTWGQGNSIRCVYGDDYLPIVTTDSLIMEIDSMITCGGNVVDSGSSSIIARGVCWSFSVNPTIEDCHTVDNVGLGHFISSISGITSYQTIFVRAYATNDKGTSYGDNITFVRSNPFNGQPCPGTPTVSDYDGNLYPTVQMGGQCWMAENLRTTHYSDGTSIALGTDTSTLLAYRYYPDNSVSNIYTYGYLYNWSALMHGDSSSSANPSGVQGICPAGWHVPSDAEWEQFLRYTWSQKMYWCDSNYNYYPPIAKSLSSKLGWNTSEYFCTPGFSPNENNLTNFSTVPAGLFPYADFGRVCYFATSDFPTYYYLSYTSVSLSNYPQNKKFYGLSVRCVKNDSISITTDSLFSIYSTSAICKGTITSENISSMSERGFCWSTSMNPTIDDSHTVDSVGIGSFTSSITGLTSGAVYYVRAYATYNGGTIYGNQLTFTTNDKPELACPDAPTVTDIDGNIYNTVQIGEQCWMKENLRTTHYADGTSIALGTDISTITAYRYYPNNDSSNVPAYGYLYNWAAVMHGASSSNANPSGVQGICPTGWHVPSYAEWTQLTDYVSSKSEYVCGNDSTNIAKTLASTFGWNSSTTSCAVGNNQSANNATGFSAVPAGRSYLDNSSNFGNNAYLWSSTAFSSHAYRRNLRYVNAYVGNDLYEFWLGYSVRCLRD